MNIPDFLEKHHVDFTRKDHHVSQNWVGIVCPFCGSGTDSRHFGIEIATGRSNCWKCANHDTALALSMLCRVTLREAIDFLSGVRSPGVRKERATGRIRLPDADDLLPAHRKYLTGRGFDPDAISRIWGIRGIGPGVEYPWRILIPIHNERGRVVSWTSRSINPHTGRRYLSADPKDEEVSHKTILYGSHLARQTVVIVEGPIDVWRIGPGAVGTFGTSYSPEQLAEMARYPRRIVCFDAEDGAQRQADKICRALSVFPGETENVVLETGKDAGECDNGEVTELRNRYLSV